MLNKLINLFLRKVVCQHEFMIKDLKLTGIPDLPPPTTNDYGLWQKYFEEVYTHESHTKRVSWPCCKCGKVFYAHCGLDIDKYGKLSI